MINIIPAIDLMDGGVVRLSEGDFNRRTNYPQNPLDWAKQFEAAGATYLHIVDLDAAKGDGNNRGVINQIVSQTQLKVQVGGGIRSYDDIKTMLDQGVDRVILGSVAYKDKAKVKQWLKSIGAERIVIGADVRDGYISTDGWLTMTKDTVIEFIKDYLEAGASTFLCTDISKDGMLAGPSFGLYNDIKDQVPKAKLIASGGVSSIEDIQKLHENGLYATVVGKAIFEGKIYLNQLF